MSVRGLIEKTVAGMGFELVELELAPRGLVRVFIDIEFAPVLEQSIADIDITIVQKDQNPDQKQVTVDDCALVSNQLSHVLTVENINYERLEVSSPGLDRSLRNRADYVRFVGQEANIKLRVPMAGDANRRAYKGVICPPVGDTLRLEFSNQGGTAMLEFTLADVEKARLVPQVNFRSRKA